VHVPVAVSSVYGNKIRFPLTDKIFWKNEQLLACQQVFYSTR